MRRLIWSTSWENLSSGFFDWDRFKPACSAIATSHSLENIDLPSCCCCLFVFNVTFNIFQSRQCLVETDSSVLTFIALPHWSIVPQTLEMIQHPVTLSWYWFCLCWGLTSQSTIFQSCRDGATASWVINQYFRGVKCLAQGHNTAAVGFEPPTSRSGVRHSTTEPPRSPFWYWVDHLALPHKSEC